MDLTNKVVVITGGARMGLALGQAFASRGAQLALTWRESEKSTGETRDALINHGAQVHMVQANLADELSIDNAFRSIIDRFSRINVLVNLASIYEKSVSLAENAMEFWDKHQAANTRSAFLVSRMAARHMKASGEPGHIVHIADWTTASGRPRYSDYTAYYVSKAGIKALVEALALEWAPHILVNAIAPGPILPPKGLTPEEHAAVVTATPLQRWGGAEEIARAAVFLSETEFVTGETIRVDGGRHLY